MVFEVFFMFEMLLWYFSGEKRIRKMNWEKREIEREKEKE